MKPIVLYLSAAMVPVLCGVADAREPVPGNDPFAADGQGIIDRVILVPPENIYYNNTQKHADPFSDSDRALLAPKKPLKTILEERTGMKFPDGSRYFYDMHSRALSVSSSPAVVNALTEALRVTPKPGVFAVFQTYESPRSLIAASALRKFEAAQTNKTRSSGILVMSAQEAFVRMESPASISKSGMIIMRVTPTVGNDLDLVWSDIRIEEDASTDAADQSTVIMNRELSKTNILLGFDSPTTVYEQQLSSGAYFGVSIRLSLHLGYHGAGEPLDEPDPQKR